MMARAMARIDRRFAELSAQNKAALVTFVTAGDPSFDVSLEIVKGLPKAGADLIELGMPFSDPMADGLSIQASSQRALKAGASMIKTLDLVTSFRKQDQETPIVCMGYYNPIYVYGVENFLADALAAGIDGLIIVDLPPEEDDELCLPALAAGLNFVRLATPTTDDQRLPAVLNNTSGFVYYVSITGITGTQEADAQAIAPEIARIKHHTDLPVCVGFGIKTADHAAAVARIADGVVVGSAIVDQIAQNLDDEGRPKPNVAPVVFRFVQHLATGVLRGRSKAAE